MNINEIKKQWKVLLVFYVIATFFLVGIGTYMLYIGMYDNNILTIIFAFCMYLLPCISSLIVQGISNDKKEIR